MRTALDPLRVDSKDYKLEFENSQVRVIRIGMGQKAATNQAVRIAASLASRGPEL